MATIFKFGNEKWAVKDSYALAYSDEDNNFKPLPMDFTRNSFATRVNKQGLIEYVNMREPRIDFLNNSKGHFLSENARTNFVPYSEDFTEWGVTSSGTTLTSNSATSPDGNQTADLLEADGTNAFARVFEGISLTSGNNCFYSVFVKKSGSHDFASIRVAGTDVGGSGQTGSTYTFTFSTETLSYEGGGTATSTFVENYGSDWYRIGIEVTNSTITEILIYPKFNTSVAGEVLIWGAQLEEGGYVTSYIPSTSGQSVSRATDDTDCLTGRFIEMNDAASVYFDVLGHPEGSGIANSSKSISALFYSADSNKSYVSLNVNGTNWKVRVQDFTSSNFKDTAISQTENIKCVVVMNRSGFSVYANGSTIVSNQSYNGTSPAGFIDQLKQIDIYSGNNDRGVYKIRDMRVFDTDLIPSEALALTS